MDLLAAFAASVLFAAAGIQLVDWNAPETLVTNETELGVHVPEPSTLVLAGLGLAGIAATRRRKADSSPDRSK